MRSRRFFRKTMILSKESLERVRFVVKMEKSHHDNRKKKKKYYFSDL